MVGQSRRAHILCTAKVKPARTPVGFSFTPLMQPSTGLSVAHASRWIGTVISEGVWHAYAARAGLDPTQEFPTREAAATALLNATK